jgi:UDP-N-acetyl-D-galactosamine dehydrogenase
VPDIINEFKSYGVHVDIVDPFASSEEFLHEYGIAFADKPGKDYDAIVVAVQHKPYFLLDETYFKSITAEKAIFADVKGTFRGKIRDLTYWSL